MIDEKHLHIEPVVASHSHYCLPGREKVLKLTSVLDISAACRSQEAPGSLPLTKDHSSKQSTAGALKFLRGNDSGLATIWAAAKFILPLPAPEPTIPKSRPQSPAER